jgi:ATP adenylyltransferase
MKYIQQNEPVNGCVFCQAIHEDNDAANLVIARSRHSFVILNRYPYNSGHLMVVPYEHLPSIEDLTAETRQEMFELANHSISVLRNVYRADAFNLGMNIGAAAGAGIAQHVHFHVLPRWNGDTNFMSTVGETRVLPEDLDDSYRRICEQWA